MCPKDVKISLLIIWGDREKNVIEEGQERFMGTKIESRMGLKQQVYCGGGKNAVIRREDKEFAAGL